MRWAIQQITRVSRATGGLTSWLMLAMIFTGAWNALARKVFDGKLSSNGFIELQWFLFAMLFLMGGATTLARDEHVRVDVLYDRLPIRARALINAVGHALLLVPFAAFMFWISLDPVLRSWGWNPDLGEWGMREQSPDPDGLPYFVVKTFIPLGFGLLALQGVAECLRALARIIDPGDGGAANRREDEGGETGSAPPDDDGEAHL